MRMLCLVLTLWIAVDAHAAPQKKPRKAAPVPHTMVIIWGGGAAPKDAQDAKASFSKLGFTSSTPLSTHFSTDIKGLKPGWHIAVVGACPGPQAQALLRRARRFYDGVYLRRVPKEGAVSLLACPKLGTPRKDLFFEPDPNSEPVHVTDTEEVVVGNQRLAVKVDVSLESNGESVQASYDVLATLFKEGKEVAREELSQGSFARVDALTVTGNKVVLETTDTNSDCGAGTFFEAEHRRRTFSIKGSGVDVAEDVVRRESGLCPPSMEGLGGCDLRCAMGRFEANQQACDNTGREKCEAALAQYDRNAEPCSCDEDAPQGD